MVDRLYKVATDDSVDGYSEQYKGRNSCIQNNRIAQSVQLVFLITFFNFYLLVILNLVTIVIVVSSDQQPYFSTLVGGFAEH
jgi:hypothetical protein